ncbi:MAG: hypothetical protein HPY44_20945 [Armatimonadetes bacterium]|nr:hypothetical protein [Armatimonadota bacterium]
MSRPILWLVVVLLCGSVPAQTATKPAAKPGGQATNGKAATGKPEKPEPPPPPPKVSPEAIRDFVRLRAERRYEALLATAKAMTVAAPTDPVGWGYLGEAQMRVGDWQQAAQALRMAVTLKSKNPADRVNLATALVQVGINRLRLGYVATEVQTLWREALTLDPENPWPYVCLGDLALSQGDARQAERDYLRAVRIDPTCFAAYAGLARAYDLLGQAASAQVCRQTAELLSPPARPVGAALSAVPGDPQSPATPAVEPASP